ncbi:SH3 domain-containing protein [Phenylobacterium sp.]|uniref:SH3 domain-containing protein n=1 Tax=Phenylobacterium sp. TaxID=1871053 RepID=UPI0025F13A7D|nr:SH3 domain-containing protein [Phenylobacterium sp.]MBX3485947.1 SH3 domain-containing protein [Phenylobacterium sp.]MCW5760059.1 SH3 domain-containing protein [Phenylobacterium sp.]
MRRLMLIAAAATLALSATPAAAQSGLGGLGGLGGLFSCDAPGQANTSGAVIGGLVGALAGSQVSKNERALGAAIGAGIGAAIGNSIGCRMDRKARQDAQVAFERALETGRPQSWSDPTTGASGEIVVVDRGPSSSGSYPGGGYTERWRFAQGVAPAVRVSSTGGAYAANGRINMRAAPSANAAIVDRLQAGERFEAAGSVSGGWLAVVEDGLIQGYVASSVARPLYGGGDRDCRLVEQTINERGAAPVRERYNACRGADGGWRLTTI